MDYKELGLFQRYDVARTDGKPLDDGELNFTLRYDKDTPYCAAARRALLRLCDDLEALGYVPLVEDLRAQIRNVEARIAAARTEKREPSSVPVI